MCVRTHEQGERVDEAKDAQRQTERMPAVVKLEVGDAKEEAADRRRQQQKGDELGQK